MKQVARNLQWPGSATFNQLADLGEARYKHLYDAGGVIFGNWIGVGNLMYARIYDAGHMVTENRPRESKGMLMKWIMGGSFEKLDAVYDDL